MRQLDSAIAQIREQLSRSQGRGRRMVVRSRFSKGY